MIRHPFQAVSTLWRARIFVPLLSATFIVMFVLNVTGAALRNEVAPQGIVSWELAGNLSNAWAILASWDAAARVSAAFNLGLDFLFLALYSTTIAFACVWLASSLPWPVLARIGVILAWGQWGAAALDAVENVALSIMLLDMPATPWPQTAWGCAVLKFGIVFLGLIYVVLGVAAHFWNRWAN